MISFVYFDVGGVVIKDFSGTNKWYELKHDLGLTATQIPEADKIWKNHKAEINTGHVDLNILLDVWKKELPLTVPEGYSMLNDFVNRFEQNPSIWPALTTIQQTCGIGLLTNMYIGMFDKIVQRNLLPPVQWDVIVDSSVVKMKKPDREIFEYAEKQLHTPHTEILFVDNQMENITAANDFGWQTFFYDSKNPEDSSQKLLQLFKK